MDGFTLGMMALVFVVCYRAGQNPRYRCMVSQGRWISQKEWDDC